VVVIFLHRIGCYYFQNSKRKVGVIRSMYGGVILLFRSKKLWMEYTIFIPSCMPILQDNVRIDLIKRLRIWAEFIWLRIRSKDGFSSDPSGYMRSKKFPDSLRDYKLLTIALLEHRYPCKGLHIWPGGSFHCLKQNILMFSRSFEFSEVINCSLDLTD